MTVPYVDDVMWVALTVYMEAEGEPWEGKLAVAWVIVNRARKRRRSIPDTIFDPKDFSAWNTDSMRRMALDSLNRQAWEDSYRAAAGALLRLVDDPTNGATHYLNIELTRKLRGGTLPGWVQEMTEVAEIGEHTFLK